MTIIETKLLLRLLCKPHDGTRSTKFLKFARDFKSGCSAEFAQNDDYRGIQHGLRSLTHRTLKNTEYIYEYEYHSTFPASWPTNAMLRCWERMAGGCPHPGEIHRSLRIGIVRGLPAAILLVAIMFGAHCPTGAARRRIGWHEQLSTP